MKVYSIRSRKRLYLIALTSVFALIAIMQGVNQYLLHASEKSAKVVNLAGRQRMLSQKITKDLLAHQEPKLTLTLYHDLNLWIEMHHSLQRGNDSLGIPQLKSEFIASLFHNISPYVYSIQQAVAEYETGGLDRKGLETRITEAEIPFLTGMDSIVFALEEQASRKIRNLEIIEIALTLISLLILYLEYILILRPSFEYMFSQQERLQVQRDKIAKQNATLKDKIALEQQTNEELRTLEEELRASVEEQTSLNEELNEKLGIIIRQKVQMESAQTLAKVGYWSYDLKSKIWWSDMMFELFGMVDDEGTNHPAIEAIQEHIHPEDLELFMDVLEKVQTENKILYRFRILCPNGKTKTLAAVIYAEKDVNTGEVLGVFGVNQDITEFIEAEKAVNHHNAALTELVRFTSSAHNQFDEQLHQLLNFTTQHFGMDTGCIGSIHEPEFSIEHFFSTKKENALQKGHVFPLNLTYAGITYKKQALFEFDSRNTFNFQGHFDPVFQQYESFLSIPLKGLDGIYGVLYFASSESKKSVSVFDHEFLDVLAQMLSYVISKNQYENELIELNQSQENIMHVVAHDLRSPLSRLYNVIANMKDNVISPDEMPRLFELAQKEFESGNALMEEMLDAFRMGSGQKGELEQLDLAQVLQEFISSNRKRAEDKGVSLGFNSIGNTVANVYFNSFKRMMENLISNALKFTHSGGSIQVILFQDQDELQLIISDTGIGIPDEIQPLLFERFNKKMRRIGLNGEKSNGLGMTIVKEIVEQHRGNIQVQSEVGKGTSFIIRFPIGLKEGSS